MSHIVVHDQIGARKPVRNFVLEWNEGVPCTVRELIAERVRCEHDRVHAPVGSLTANEIVNLPTLFEFHGMDADTAVRRALTAFERNGFMLLVGRRQATGLDDVVEILPRTEVTFIKLIPLKGG